MKKMLLSALSALLASVVIAAPALAHVTVQPNEAVIGSFSRFVVRVPNESPKASTIRIEVKLPPLAFVSFEPKDGWERETRDVTLDEPIEAFGQEITETVGTVIWSGGSIGPGEFQEFGFSARMPEEETTLQFDAIQEYDDGEIVRWNGAPDSETPAAQLTVLDIGAGEGEGQLSVLARTQSEVADDPGGEAPSDEGTETDPDVEQAVAAGDDGDDGNLPLVISIVAALLAAAALLVTLRMRYLIRFLLAAVVIALMATPAFAHAERTSSDPKAGSRVDEAPEHLYINFTEPPTADAQVAVTDGCGRDVVEDVEAQQQTLHMTLAEGQPGRWQVAFRAVSGLDGHSTEDSFGFRVRGKADCSAPPEDDPSPEPTEQAAPQPDDDGGFPVLPVVGGLAAVVVVAALIRLRG